MTGGLAITGEGEHVGQLALGFHLLELCLQPFCYLLTGGAGERRTVVLVETALAVDAVEGAHLTIGRHQVDAKRDAKSATVNGAEDGRRINNCTHIGRKITKKSE
jgi:hypothetical protein